VLAQSVYLHQYLERAEKAAHYCRCNGLKVNELNESIMWNVLKSKQKVEVPSDMEHMSFMDRNQASIDLVSSENECAESYVGKELDINSISPLDLCASISDSVTSNDRHTGLTKDMDDLVISGSPVMSDQEALPVGSSTYAYCKYSTFVDEELEKRGDIAKLTSSNQCTLAREVYRVDNISSSKKKENKSKVIAKNEHTLDSK